MPTPVLLHYAQTLVQRVAAELKSEHGLGSMAPSIYDTAWVAMIPSPNQNGNRWLFPESFNYILDHQGSDGGWDPLEQASREAKYPDNLWVPDCIIHSLAALLALCRHFQMAACDGTPLPSDPLRRIFRAKSFLDSKLGIWRLEATAHFGFELLVPVLLRLLEDEGVSFDFPVKEELMARYETASNIDLDWLYTGPCRVPLFCLEAFIGKVDFGRVSHLVTPAGIAASPASSAAYLINSPTWSPQCEAYLRHVVYTGQGNGNGGVGGVFPLEIFEPSWVLTALLENGFTADELGRDEVDAILAVIRGNMEDGVTGATHVFFPDADDTSRAITTLNHQGYEVSPAGMVKRFETDRCFETFDTQMPNRITSVSVNGNVLSSLVHSPDPNAFAPQIEKVARFLCEQWRPDRKLEDHWNMSEYYGLMHMAQSLVPLLTLSDQNSLPSLSAELVQDMIPLCCQQLLSYILQNQNTNGSWGELNSIEETAYAVVALANMGSHAVSGIENDQPIDVQVGRGKQFLLENWTPGSENPDRIWTGKVLHGVSYVGEAYVLAALKSSRSKKCGKVGS